MEPVGPLGRRRPKEPGEPQPTERAELPAHLRPMAFAGPLGHPRETRGALQRAGRSATEPAGHRVGPPLIGPAGHPGARSAPGPAEPVRVPAASATMHPAVRRRAQPGRAPAPGEGRGRERDPTRAGSGGQPPVPDGGPGTGTGTGTRLRRVRRADGAPTGPPTAPEPAGPAPQDPTRTGPAPQGPTRTGPARRDPTRTGPAPRDPVRITHRGGVPGFRPGAAARRTGPGKTGPGKTGPGRARPGRAGPVSRTRSSLRSSNPGRAPSCTACRTT
jgi:hypothetical protein